MKILLLEPFFTGSHQSWALGYQRHSRHQVEILSLKGQFWKWRMHGGAVSLARMFLAGDFQPELLLATSMLDLSTFLALTRRRTAQLPALLYMHENQLTYPWSPTDQDPALQRDRHYAFINYSSMLAATAVCFNSHFHRQALLQALPAYLRAFPDLQELGTVDQIRQKSQVLPLGLDLRALEVEAPTRSAPEPPLILWNHRWEYDKGPEEFFELLMQAQRQGLPFRLVVLGQAYRKAPPIFRLAARQLGPHIVHWGYVNSRTEYARWLHRAHLLPVTSRHDFFGASVAEAIYCGCYPLLPFRLAYPEHLPASLHADYFYQDHSELQDKLFQLLQSPARPHAELRAAMARYDWQHMAPVYDELMEQAVQQPGSGP